MKERMINESSPDKLECVSKLCYLRDLIGVGGEAEEASRARVRWVWPKFRDLALIRLQC